jgi:hypothetical protein
LFLLLRLLRVSFPTAERYELFFPYAALSTHYIDEHQCKNYTFVYIYEGRLQSSWTHLITPSRNFVEVR